MNLSRRILLALKGVSKSAKTMELLGCNINQFKTYNQYNKTIILIILKIISNIIVII